ncbi:MAG: HAD family phosphatase [Muribaculaceae bacterium]|nr:HAD family phosphatase [Muribaculaceae bacterium]MBP3639096.1 HAD family phosphatase [Muribaculaceae bacterium]
MKIAALFDLDGVLIDSESIYTVFWNRMNELFPTGIDNFSYVIKGTTLPQILDRYFPDPKVQAELRVYLKKQEAEMVYRIFPGVERFLKALKEKGIPTAIVTSSNDAKMKVLFDSLPGFRDYFDVVVTDTDVTRSKPDPQGYMLAAERLGVPSEHCVVFEDSRAGLEAGRRAGGKVVAVATTLTHEDIAGCGDIVIDSFEELTPERVEALF